LEVFEKGDSLELEAVLSEVLRIMDTPVTRSLCEAFREHGDVGLARWLVVWTQKHRDRNRGTPAVPLKPLPPPAVPVVARPYFWINAKGRMAEAEAMKPLPAEAKYWCYPGAASRTPNPNYTPPAPKQVQSTYTSAATTPAPTWELDDQESAT
jgi:hypothetical protein